MSDAYSGYYPGRVRLQVIDGIRLFDRDWTTPGVYVAVAPYAKTTRWPGCTVWISCDGGTEYMRLVDLPRQATTGIATDALDSYGSPPGPDTTSTVQIQLEGGEIAALAALDLCSNFALIGDEVVQFRDVTEDDDRLYTLDHFLRGLKDTEAAIGTHAAGDLFLLLDPETVVFVPLEESMVGETLYFKATTPGMALDDAEVVTIGGFTGGNWTPAQPGPVLDSAAPGVGDDVDDGISVGQIHVDTAAGKAYICVDNTAGAAVWVEIT